MHRQSDSQETRGPSSRTAVALVLCIACALATAPAAGARSSADDHRGPKKHPVAAQPSLIGPYFGAPFTVTQHPASLGQSPSWTTGGQVLSNRFDSAGIEEIYRSNLNGTAQACLTCNTVKGPNGFPQDRGQHDWILFESFGQQPTHTGSPGLGGYGGDLYVMRENGTHVYRLTTTSDPDSGGKRFSAALGTPYDNFHAFWSPDGKHIAWTHTEANSLLAGGQTWEMMAGDFTTTNGVPSIINVRVVGPPYGVYETEPWAPDGSGFLFCAAGGYNSPYQSTPPGWAHMQLYYMRIYGPGASPEHPLVTQISDNVPAYNEQAVFTPDMKEVIMMSNRNNTKNSWYDAVVSAAIRTGYDAPNEGAAQTLQFLSDFSGTDFNDDLYEVDVATGALRRITNFGPYVLPEFFWNSNYTRILWELERNGGNYQSTTWTGQFQGITAAEQKIPKHTPADLNGQPIDMARIGSQAQTIRDPGPTNNTSVPVAAPRHPAPGLPHAAKTSDSPSIPAVTASYLPIWLAELNALFTQTAKSYTDPPLLGAVTHYG